jgi:type II secretory pathway pseudopilin PulG
MRNSAKQRVQLRQDRRHGISLVEVVISTLIVGFVLVAALNTTGSVIRSQRMNAERIDSNPLAAQLLSEVVANYYTDPEEPAGPIGLETGESAITRVGFDDIDDYHGWTATPPESNDGTVISGYTGWTRTVTVNHADPTTGQTVGLESGIKRIQVQVTAPDGVVTSLVCLRSESGGIEQPPAMDTTVVTWVGAELQIGSAATAVSAVSLTNHAADQ